MMRRGPFRLPREATADLDRARRAGRAHAARLRPGAQAGVDRARPRRRGHPDPVRRGSRAHPARPVGGGGMTTALRAPLPTALPRARAAWSRIAEPGDMTAARLVAARGAGAGVGRRGGGLPPRARPVRASPGAARRRAGPRGGRGGSGPGWSVPEDEEWPMGLDDLDCPPYCLWVRGDVAAGRGVRPVGCGGGCPQRHRVRRDGGDRDGGRARRARLHGRLRRGVRHRRGRPPGSAGPGAARRWPSSPAASTAPTPPRTRG